MLKVIIVKKDELTCVKTDNFDGGWVPTKWQD